MSRKPNDEMARITMPVPPQRLRWLASEMDASGVPYRIQQDPQTQTYSVETYQVAQPILQSVLATTNSWDLFDRKPANRSRVSDAMGFFIALVVVGTIVMQSGGFADMAVAAGFNGNVIRGVGILAVGVTVTLIWSEMFMGNDPRRGMFRHSMIMLFLVAAMWFILSGCGMDMAGELARWVP